MVNFLKEDLSSSEKELRAKFNDLLSVQNNLIECNKNIIQTQSLVDNEKQIQENVYNPILTNDEQKENSEPQTLEASEFDLKVLVDKNATELDNFKESQKNWHGVFEENVNSYNTFLATFEGQYTSFLENSADLKTKSVSEITTILDSGKTSYVGALTEFSEKLTKLLETPLPAEIDARWVTSLDKNIMPKNIDLEIAMKQTMFYAEQIADKNYHQKVTKETSETRTPLIENINEINTQHNDENEMSFLDYGFREMKNVFSDIGTNIRDSFNIGRADREYEKPRKNNSDVKLF